MAVIEMLHVYCLLRKKDEKNGTEKMKIGESQKKGASNWSS